MTRFVLYHASSSKSHLEPCCILCQACRALRLLAESPEHQSTFLEADALPLLVALLRDPSPNCQLLRPELAYLLLCFAQLVHEGEESAPLLARYGAIQVGMDFG